MLVAAGMLTACADDDDAGPEATPPAPTTRTVDSSHGPIEIPLNPDVIFFGLPEGKETDATTERLLENTYAVRNNQFFRVPRDIWALEVVEALFGTITGLESAFAGKDFTLSGEYGTHPRPPSRPRSRPTAEHGLSGTRRRTTA